MAIQFNDNLEVNAPKNLDNKKGVWENGAWRPFNSIAEVFARIDRDERYITLKVPVLKDGVPVDHWWVNGIDDEHLVPCMVATPGQGLTKDTQDRLTLDLESKQLVAPSISTTWTLFKTDGTTPYTPATSSSKSVTVDRGVKANVYATFRYPNPNANQAPPSTISGDWGNADPGPNTDSAVMNNGGNQIADDKTFSVTLSKPKSGLVVFNNQVQFPSGNDTTSDSISIAFRLRMYWGTIAKNGTSQPILDADILDLYSEFRTNRLKSFTNFGGGGKRIIIVTQRGTGGDNWGECAFRVNGLANTAFTKVRSASAFINAAGYSTPVDVWLSNSEYNSPLDSFEVI